MLNTIDGYENILRIVLSPKRDNEIEGELFDLLGSHNFELLSQLIEKRDLIKEQCRSIEEVLKKETAHAAYRPKNFDIGVSTVGVAIEHRTMGGGKGGKKKRQHNAQPE